MNFVGLLLFFITTIGLGYGTLSFFIRVKRPLFFWLPLAYGLGLYIITLELFVYLFIFRASFSFPIFLSLVAFQLAAIFLVLIKNNNFGRNVVWPRLEPGALKRSEKILLSLLALLFLFSFAGALARPVATYDSLTMWSYKAKVLFYNNQVDFNPDSPDYLGGGGHRNYPWQIPLAHFWLHHLSGGHNEIGANFIFAAFYVFTLFFLYHFLRSRFSRPITLLAVFLLASLPLYFYHSYNAYADLPLGFAIMVSLAFLVCWQKSNEKKDLVLSGLFLGIAIWTKDTGVIFAIAALSGLTCYLALKRKGFKPMAIYLSAVFVPLSAWLWFKSYYDLGVSNVDSGLGFHYRVFPAYFIAFFFNGSWHIWWYAVFATLAFNFKSILKSDLLYGWLIIMLYIGGTFLLYLFTERYLYALDYTASLRNLIAILPATFLIVPLSWPRFGANRIQ